MNWFNKAKETANKVLNNKSVKSVVAAVETAHKAVDRFEVACTSKVLGKELDKDMDINELEDMVVDTCVAKVKNIKVSSKKKEQPKKRISTNKRIRFVSSKKNIIFRIVLIFAVSCLNPIAGGLLGIIYTVVTYREEVADRRTLEALEYGLTIKPIREQLSRQIKDMDN